MGTFGYLGPCDPPLHSACAWPSMVQLYNDAFYNRAKHGLKFGAAFMAQQDDSYVVSTAPGNGTFTSARVTPQTAPCLQPDGQYNGSCGALVNFLTDQPRTAARPQDLTALTKHYLRDKIFGANQFGGTVH